MCGSCGCWANPMREEHRALDSQKAALEAVLEGPSGPRSRNVMLFLMLRSFAPRLETHLRKEEEALFPAIQRLLGTESGPLVLLRDQHEQLRAYLNELAELLQVPEAACWERLESAGKALVDLLEDHEEKEGRFFIDLLASSLEPQELMGLARQFQQAACRCGEEET